MNSPISLETLSTPSEVYEGLLRFGEKDALKDKCFFPAVDAAAGANPPEPAAAVGAVISIRTLFGDAQDIMPDLVDLEMTIVLDWAERCFKGSAVSVLAYDLAATTSEAPDATDLPFGQLPPDTPMVCDDPDLQLLVVPLRATWARRNGSPRPILFEEHADAMAEACFGAEGRKKHLEALKASLLAHLQAIVDGHHAHGSVPDRLLGAIRSRVDEWKASARDGLVPAGQLAAT